MALESSRMGSEVHTKPLARYVYANFVRGVLLGSLIKDSAIFHNPCQMLPIIAGTNAMQNPKAKRTVGRITPTTIASQVEMTHFAG